MRRQAGARRRRTLVLLPAGFDGKMQPADRAELVNRIGIGQRDAYRRR